MLGKASLVGHFVYQGYCLQYIKAICLDLDDTLWDVAPVIHRAELAVYAWFAEHYPQVTQIYSKKEMSELRHSVVAEFPDQSHDLSALRKRTFEKMAIVANCPSEMASQAFEVFHKARNEVSIFEDVVPALQWLGARYQLFALTNGNADLEQIGLADYFDHVFTAKDLGAAKPDPIVFDSVCRHIGLEYSAVLHVGDNPRHDIEPARLLGMGTIWVNRKNCPWPDSLAQPDHMVPDLRTLVELLS